MVSLIDVVEQLNVNPDVEFPIPIVYPLEIVTLWSRADIDQPAQGRSRIRVRKPSDELIRLGDDATIDLVKFERFRHRLALVGFPLTEPGKYVFEVELLEGSEDTPQVVAKIPLFVKVANRPRPG
jgi:hypothetical protein